MFDFPVRWVNLLRWIFHLVHALGVRPLKIYCNMSSLKERAELPSGFPEKWRNAVAARLGSAPVQAWLELDLDEQLRFGAGLLVVTADELWSLTGEGSDAGLRHWALDQDIALLNSDHNGVGLLELVQDGRRIAAWRYTLGAHVQASRLMEQFEARREFLLHGRPLQLSPLSLCPQCQSPLDPDADECEVCAQVIHTPPSTWTLLRLWRFAHPYRWQLLTGFLLTLASTAATLVPPYLTMPLMDKVLIPYQNGQPIDTGLVTLLLGGLLGAALLAWVLGARRDHQTVRLTRRDPFERDLVITENFDCGAEFAKVLHDVEGERVVVVHHEQFDFLHGVHSSPSSTSSLARSRARALCSVSRHSISGTESATTPAAACT